MQKKLLAWGLLISVLLTGCSGGKTSTKETGNNKTLASGAKVIDIKKKYGIENEKAIMPMYNVEKNKKFIFNFNSDLKEVVYTDAISVHTDSRCLDESKISYIGGDYLKDGKSQIEVKPLGPGPLASESDTNSKDSTWGNAPMYYIKINYDMDSTEQKKLDKPVIIPFTVKSEVPVPNVRYEISSDGRLKILWDKVEGAEKYKIYNAATRELMVDSNKPINGPEKGYTGVYPLLEAEVTQTEFNDFLRDGKGGISVQDNGDIVDYQNFGVKGEYYVTAIKDGKESRFSVPVSTPALSKQLPQSVKTDISFSHIDSVDLLPKTAQVKFIDGSFQDRDIIYETKDVKIREDGYTPIYFRIKGTALRKYTVVVKMTEKDKEVLSQNTISDNTGGKVEPRNNIDQVPKPNVPTIIDDTNTKDSSKEDAASKDALVEKQKENTQKRIEEGNKETVPVSNVVKDVQVNANSALEEYLALQMVDVKTNISLKAFPSAQNFDTLSDALQKVIYQNPLILNVSSYRYDYNTLTLQIVYDDSPDSIKKKQNEIITEAKKIVSSTIKSGMPNEEKRKALYDYLEKNTKYDNAALESAKNNNFQKVDPKFNDAFNTYGIMVKKVGVCMSYAYTYKLLCDLAEVECIVVTGDIGGLPHAWNKIKIDNEWLNVDTTNNQTNSGIPYMLYNANDETAKQVTYTTDKLYWIDGELSNFIGNSNKNEYYSSKGFEVKGVEEYTAKVAELLKKGDKVIVLRMGSKVNNQQLLKATAEAFVNANKKDNLNTAEMSSLSNYIVIKY